MSDTFLCKNSALSGGRARRPGYFLGFYFKLITLLQIRFRETNKMTLWQVWQDS